MLSSTPIGEELTEINKKAKDALTGLLVDEFHHKDLVNQEKEV